MTDGGGMLAAAAAEVWCEQWCEKAEAGGKGL